MKVTDIMSTDVLTLSGSATLAQAKTWMQRRMIRHIPIVEGGRLLGLICQRDVLVAEGPATQLGDPTARNEHQVRVDSFMQTNPLSITQRTTVKEAALILQRHKLSCLPVMDAGHLVGIVTDSDFVNVAINLLELAETQEGQLVEEGDW